MELLSQQTQDLIAFRQILARETERILDGLVENLNDETPQIQESAVRALASLSDVDESTRLSLLETNGLLHGLVRALTSEHPAIQEQATRALANLTDFEDEETRMEILETDGLISSLVPLLLSEVADIQRRAAKGLSHLASLMNEDSKTTISSTDGLLLAVIHCLRSNVTEIQYLAAQILGALGLGTSGGDAKEALLEALRLDSMLNPQPKLSGLFPALTNCLQCQDARVRSQVALTIATIADGGVPLEVQEAIAETPELLSLLCRIIRNDEEENNVQDYATAAVAALAEGDPVQQGMIKRQLAETEGLLGALTHAIRTRGLYSQERATLALSRLAQGDGRCGGTSSSLGSLIVGVQGLLLALVHSLGSENVQIQRNTIDAIYKLSRGGVELEAKPAIISTENMLTVMMHTLLHTEDSIVQHLCSCSLRQLAWCEDDEARSVMATTTNLLSGIVSVLQTDRYHLQEEAARTFAGLASGEAEVPKHAIAMTEGALFGLMQALRIEHPPLQEAAAQAVANIARNSSRTVKEAIMEVAPLIQVLISVIRADVGNNNKDDRNSAMFGNSEVVFGYPMIHRRDVQRKAATAIANIVAGAENSVKNIILFTDGAIAAITYIIENPHLCEENVRAVFMDLLQLANRAEDTTD